MDKAAATIDDKTVKVINLSNTGKHEDVVDFIKEMGLNEMNELEGKLPETMSGSSVKNIIDQIIQEAEGKDSGGAMVIEMHTSNFWNYAGNLNRTASIDRIFEEWINKQSISLDTALDVWNKVQSDVNEAFSRKKVSVERDLGSKPIFVILVTNKETTGNSKNLCILKGYIALYSGYKSFDYEIESGNPAFSEYLKNDLGKYLRNVKIPNRISMDILDGIVAKVSNYLNNPDKELTGLLRHYLNTKEETINIELYNVNEEQILSKPYSVKDLPKSVPGLLKKKEDQMQEPEQEFEQDPL
jgi:hypothetical protein